MAFQQPSGLSPSELELMHQLACIAIVYAVSNPSSLHKGVVDGQPETLLATVTSGRWNLESLPKTVQVYAGAFVTIKNGDRLRGCQGCIAATGPVYGQVLSCAIKSALADHRFLPCTVPELSQLHVGISILTPPIPIPSHEHFQLGVHGIIIKKNGCRAVFLPEVPIEHNFTKETTLSRLSAKAGLPNDAWREGASFEVFYTQKFGKPMLLELLRK